MRFKGALRQQAESSRHCGMDPRKKTTTRLDALHIARFSLLLRVYALQISILSLFFQHHPNQI
uniref:Uncharacterized protein n=1 Tax=Arundo donax TaxID=35708 RepID=A0A0A9DPY7_ARUDO